MFRLAVIGGDRTEWRDVARRLRGAALDPDVSVGSADGAVLLRPDDAVVTERLAAGKAILLSEGALPDATFPPGVTVLNRERYLPSRQLIHQQLDRLGEPGLVRLHRWSASPVPLSHDLDVVLWLFGRTPDLVHSLQPDPGMLQVHLGFPGGGMALIGHACGPAFGSGFSSLSVIAASGAAYADDHAGRQLLFADATAHAVMAGERVLALAAMVQDWVDALRNGVDLSHRLAEWGKAVAVRAAVARSLEAADAVPLEAP